MNKLLNDPARLWLCIVSMGLLVIWGQTSELHLVSQPRYEWYIHLECELIDFCRTVIDQEHSLYWEEESLQDYSQVISFLEEATQHGEQTMSRELGIIENPLAMFQVKRWLVARWPPILTLMEDSLLIQRQPALLTQLGRLAAAVTQIDLTGAVQELITLLQIYDVTIPGMVLGSLGLAQDIPLAEDDVIQIVESANELSEHQVALDFLLAYPLTNMSDTKLPLFQSTLGSTYIKLGKYEKAREVYECMLEKDPTNRAAISNIRLIESKVNSNHSDSNEERETSDFVKTVRKYCTDNDITPDDDESILLCYENILNGSDEVLRTETLSHTPHILMVHDVFTNHRIRILLERAADKLWEAYDAGSRPRRRDPQDAFSWMEFYSVRLENITKSQVPQWRDREGVMSWVKVNNYGAGIRDGLFLNETKGKDPNKLQIAHYYIFLNEPKSGGDLVFPNINLRIRPVKGAAIFWETRTWSGSVDTRVDSLIECPVPVGYQWVALSDVRYNQMEYNFCPCDSGV